MVLLTGCAVKPVEFDGLQHQKAYCIFAPRDETQRASCTDEQMKWPSIQESLQRQPKVIEV